MSEVAERTEWAMQEYPCPRCGHLWGWYGPMVTLVGRPVVLICHCGHEWTPDEPNSVEAE